MKKNRLAASALAVAVSITACGCGDQIYQLTEEEEAVIVHYSAHAVSKFNKKQSEGIQDVAVLKALRELKEKEAEERRKQMEEEERERQEKLDQQEEESGNVKKPESSTNAEQTKPSDGQNAQPEVSYVSLKKALRLSGVDAIYRSYEFTSAYKASQSYMVRANSGNDLLVLHVNLKNSGSKTAECDILSKMPSFRLTVNGNLSVSADTTILLNDLGTYQGRIRSGDKARTVLIFQVKKGAVRSVENMDLEVTVGGEASLVHLAG